MSDENYAKSIIENVERLGSASFFKDPELWPGLALAVLPRDKKLEDLQPYIDKLRDAPKRIKTSAEHTSVDSFIDYMNRFKRDDSAVFVMDAPEKPGLLGVIDFHGQGAEAAPKFGEHKAFYAFPMSDQLKAWTAISGSPLGHAEFATFLADRGVDISNPPLDWMQVEKSTVELLLALLNIGADAGEVDDGAEDIVPLDEDDDRYIPRSALYKLRRIRFGSAARLMQMARTIEVSVSAKATEGYQPKTGERTVMFTEEHETSDGKGRKIIVPDAFLLRAPIWEGETPQLIPVRLQYRKNQGRLSWFVTLCEWSRVVRYSVRVEAERVAAATGLPLFVGKP